MYCCFREKKKITKALVMPPEKGEGVCRPLGFPPPPPTPVPLKWGVHSDAPGQRRGPLPSSVWTETGTVRGLRWHNLPREREGVWGGEDRPDRGRGRARGGERPMGTAAYGGRGFKGKGSGKWREADSCRRLQTATQQVSCQPPTPVPK